MDGQAVMVTSGATPIEGIPGQKSCGDIDASIVLALSEQKGWSPEQINIKLTEESGIKGLAGKDMTIKDVFESKDKKIKEIAEIIFYRILLACGMAIAAMGGVERIIFSGRYAKDAGKIIKEKLEKKLSNFVRGNNKKIKWTIFEKPLNEIIAEDAIATILKNKNTRGMR
jgi:acetate kinase